MSARSFQTTTGIQHFLDARDLGAKDVEPDSFFYDKALQLMSQAAADARRCSCSSISPPIIFRGTPVSARPDAGVARSRQRPVVDEYLRRQTMSADDYARSSRG